ncbi:MAG: hypothetical protein ACE5IP_06985 [Terriglobia bacterium]
MNRAWFLAALMFAGQWGSTLSVVAQETSRPPEREDGALEPAAILHQVYEMSFGAPPYERAFVLFDLAQASMQIDRELAAKYAKELFEESQHVPMEWYNYRRASQMNAVRLLASVGDVSEAAELFDRMDPPKIGTGGKVLEDMREGALQALVPALLEGDRVEGLAWATRAVRQVGASGHYPYVVAQQVIQELLNDDSLEAEILYSEAITAFEKNKGLSSARLAFVDLLLKLEGKFRPGLERQGVQAAVDALLSVETPKNVRTMVRLTLKNEKSVTLRTLEDQSLFRLLPLFAKYEPERADKLLRERAGLQMALEEGGAIQSQEAVVVVEEHGEGTELDAAAARGLDWRRVRRINQVAPQDPEEALRLSDTINRKAPRAAALARTAAAVANDDPQRASTLLKESLSLLGKVEEPSERLRVLPAVLRAYVNLKNSKQVADTYVAILDLGTELLEQEIASDPHVPLFVTTSLRQLLDATKFAAAFDPEPRLLELSRLDNPLLQSHLMIEVARTIGASRQE